MYGLLFTEELERRQRSFERQLESQKLDYEQQIAHLQQDNYVLKAKVLTHFILITVEPVYCRELVL